MFTIIITRHGVAHRLTGDAEAMKLAHSMALSASDEGMEIDSIHIEVEGVVYDSYEFFRALRIGGL